MRIVVVTSEFYPISLAASVRMGPWVDAHIQAGHEVKVITTKASKGIQKYNIEATISSGPKNNHGFARRLLAEIIFGMEVGFRALFSKADAFVVTSPPFFMTLIAIRLIRLKNKVYVLDIRDDYPRIFKEQGLIKETNPLYKFFDRMATRSFKKALLVTGATAGLVKNIIDKSVSDENVVLLRNGFIKPEGFKMPEKRNKFTAVFHGNLGKFQNIELLLAVADKLKVYKHIEFVVIGSGAQDNLLKETELRNILYLGRISHDQIMHTIGGCHLGLSFRIDGKISQDAFPVKVYEYIGAGIPSIVTPVSEAGKFVMEQRIGLEFSNQNVKDICDLILKMANEKEYYSTFCANILNLKKDFNRISICQEFVRNFEMKFKAKN